MKRIVNTMEYIRSTANKGIMKTTEVCAVVHFFYQCIQYGVWGRFGQRVKRIVNTMEYIRSTANKGIMKTTEASAIVHFFYQCI
jgi:hypothetical protein